MKYALIFFMLCSAALAKDAKEYNLTVSVVSAKSIPFRGNAQASSQTNCYANGNNITCNTADTSFQGIPGVQFVMLGHASDGNTYMFSCDAQWRWSHCVGLQTGNFHARLEGGQLAIEYLDNKGKAKEAKYRIMSVETTSSPAQPESSASASH